MLWQQQHSISCPLSASVAEFVTHDFCLIAYTLPLCFLDALHGVAAPKRPTSLSSLMGTLHM